VKAGQPIDRIASVASFFISRIDAEIDKKIDAGTGGEEAKALKGKVAIANAKLAYAWYQDFISSDRWQALAAKGAQPQRLLCRGARVLVATPGRLLDLVEEGAVVLG
jgi:transaldolase/glucose-6-phosphate isomerase